MDEPVQIGIIGLGHIGKFHIQAIRQFKEFNLLAVCDRNKEFESLAPNGVDFYSDYQQMLRDERIDTVVIATPNYTHYYIARKVLEMGKNVILEKPAAESMRELDQLEKSANQADLSIYYAFHAAMAFDVEWFVNYYNKAENKLELGPVTGFYSRFYDPYIKQGVLLSEAEGLQDCWLDSGINAISVIQRIVNLKRVCIENVSAALNHMAKPRFLQCQTEFSFSINGEDLAGLGIIDTNWTTGRNHKSTILSFGESHNSIRINHSTQKVIRRYPNGNEIELIDTSMGNTRFYNHYIGVFTDYLNHRKSGTSNSKSAITAHRLLFQAEEAINRTL